MALILDDLTVENSVTLQGGAVGTPSSLTPDLANAAGSATSLSRSDHIHNVPTASAIGLDATSTSTQGAAATFARSNHTHAISSGAPSTQTPDQANATGSSANFARADHIHAIATAAASQLTPDLANAQGSSTSFARADHIHNVPTASAIGLDANSTSTQGAAATFARSNHTHAIASGAASSQTPDQANAAGTSVNFARADHVHNIATAAAVTISGNANAQGAAANFARSNHTHQLTVGAAVLDSIPQYDASNWQAVPPEQILNPARAWNLKDEFVSNGVGIGDLQWSITNVGGGSSVTNNNTNVDSSHPGIIRILSGAGGGNSAAILLNATNMFVLGGGALYNEWLVNLTLATVTNDYTLRIGLGDSATADFTNGVYFQYNRGTSVNWLIKTAAAATRTTTTTATAVATGWTKLGISINAAASSITFFVNGASVGTIATNIPTAATNFAAHQVRVAGTPTAIDLDYFWTYQRFTAAR